eukprot:TRINITY_DN5356_c0_g1_i1.p1 TRINITY_DN5356_c0_g1~~TRINITY_DN5356_c0_g1_i1.p1  ORF type:complete len:70 (+),score=13.25 TRINITY_DN5356_c0_g1_i1:227-436(+)
MNSELQDHVVLVLRKAMFARDMETRRCSLSGFAAIISPERKSDEGYLSLSQSSTGTQKAEKGLYSCFLK